MSDQARNCTACGAPLLANARFCTECGHPVDAAQAEPPLTSGLETIAPGGVGGGTIPTPEPHNPDGQGSLLNPGDNVAGKYVIERQIGQGGMGAVYKATESLTGQTVALKIIRSESVADEASVRRLINEGMTTRQLAHQNIVHVYDIGLHGEQPYIAMEYIEGRPLHVWRSEKIASGETVPIFVVGQIIKEVLNGLEVAHGAGVIHRDLKPENIMLVGEPDGKNARVKIVDFGIALAAKINTGAGTSTGYGTQLYMAPEQIRNADLATPAADLYSLSKIFYELLIGVLPTGHWQPPSGSRSDVPTKIDELIEQGLSNAPNARPQSAANYRELMIAGFNNHSRPSPMPKPGSTGLPKWALYAGGGVAALVVLGIIGNMLPEESSSGQSSSSGGFTPIEQPAPGKKPSS